MNNPRIALLVQQTRSTAVNSMGIPPNQPSIPIDLKDPRIRVTFADVAMRIARDGPMYGVIILVGVLALRGTTTAMESVVGAAIALLARSHPPPEYSNKVGGFIGMGVMFVFFAAVSHAVIGCN